MFDVIVNENIASTTKKEKGLLELLTALLASYSQEKFGLTLDSAPSFPKLKYKGSTVQFQRIKAKRAPKISTLSQDEPLSIPKPSFKLFVVDGEERLFDGRRGEAYRYEISLPMLITGEKLLLEYSEVGFHMRAGTLYEICLAWPSKIDTNSISSVFDTTTRNLVIEFKAILKASSTLYRENQAEKGNLTGPSLTSSLLTDIF